MRNKAHMKHNQVEPNNFFPACGGDRNSVKVVGEFSIIRRITIGSFYTKRFPDLES